MKKKPYWDMTKSELADATKEFDQDMVVERSRPMTSAQHAQWNRAKRKRGRPKVGLGFQRISVSIEKGLLKRATAMAKKRCITRSQLLAQLLERELSTTKRK